MTQMIARLEDLDRRVNRIERHLGLLPERAIEPEPQGEFVPGERAQAEAVTARTDDAAAGDVGDVLPVETAAAAPPKTPVAPVAAEGTGGATPAEETPVEITPDAMAAMAASASSSSRRVPPPIPPTPAPAIPPCAAGVLRYDPRPAREPARQGAMEQLIGLKLAGWIGAIVLVIGAGLGIKYAYDIGFFAGVSPVVWLSLLSLFGIALIGAGEFVYRRINAISATGLFGAGVATLFLVSYAGHGYYGLYQQQTAFTLMGLSTLVGAGVAMRGKLVSIGALSLIGGLLAPLVLRGDSSLIVPFLSYLLMLQVVALVLAWWGASPRWWALRGLSLAGTVLWTGAIVLPRPEPWGAAMWFTLLYAGLYQFEVTLSSLRTRRSGAERAEVGAGVMFSLIVTSVLTAGMLWIFRDAAPATRGLWVLSFAGAALAAGLGLQQATRENARARALAYGYRTQTAVLLLLAAPVALGGASLSIGWAALAVGLAAVSARTSDRAMRYTAVAAWVLAAVSVCRFIGTVSGDHPAARTWLTVLGQPIAAWAVLGWATALVGHAVAWLLRGESRKDRHETIALSAAASVIFVAATIPALSPLGATAVLLAYAWALVAGDLINPRLMLLPQGWAVIALTAGKWAFVDTLAARLSPQWRAADVMPIFNPVMLSGVAVAGSIIAIYRLRRGAIEAALARIGPSGAAPATVILTVITGLMVLGLTVEVDRVVQQFGQRAWPLAQLRQMAWTMLWTAFALVYLWVYTRLDPPAPSRARWRRMAWLLAGALAMKFIIVDTLLQGLRGLSYEVTPLANIQVMTALVVTAALGLVRLMLRSGGTSARDDATSLRVAWAATVVLLWAGTLEIDRLVVGGFLPGAAVWGAWQVRQFAWSAWWTAGIVTFLAIADWRDETAIRRLPMLRTLAAAVVVLGVKYLLLDTLFFRLTRGPAPAVVMANLQTFAGSIIFGGLLLVRHFLGGSSDIRAARTRTAAGAMAMVMLLWLGTLEIDRAFQRWPVVMGAFTDPRLAEQVALSIFWSGFAIACVVAGFRFRIAGLRYCGLALFALTLLKVGLIDLRQAEMGYRILSFMGLGALLLVTSVLYGKRTPVLLRPTDGGGENDRDE